MSTGGVTHCVLPASDGAFECSCSLRCNVRSSTELTHTHSSFSILSSLVASGLGAPGEQAGRPFFLLFPAAAAAAVADSDGGRARRRFHPWYFPAFALFVLLAASYVRCSLQSRKFPCPVSSRWIDSAGLVLIARFCSTATTTSPTTPTSTSSGSRARAAFQRRCGAAQRRPAG